MTVNTHIGQNFLNHIPKNISLFVAYTMLHLIKSSQKLSKNSITKDTLLFQIKDKTKLNDFNDLPGLITTTIPCLRGRDCFLVAIDGKYVKIEILKPYPPHDDKSKLGLWEVFGHEGRALMNGISAFIKKTPEIYSDGCS